MIKQIVIGMAIVGALSACQKPQAPAAPLDGKALAEQFLKPQAGKATTGILFDDKGQVAAIVTADGKLAEPCRLPSPEGDNTAAAAGTLPICHGTTDTAIYGISQIAIVEHKGSTCQIYRISPPGINYQICW